ncbi:L-gulonolactone oxidase isoform X1 [Nematostella vectensis]|uniref:L-gulonolactone oxidase isoform X1 n=1 Tax=Nematostella vectensis TaxID=45351 RepID=UPI002077603F|nr:L-gulonolactone oxidase isoform X1 [Nematostella vectensis]
MSSLEAKKVLARGKKGHRFTNWSTTYSCSPELYFEPESTDEIRQILLIAKELHKRVRVVGSGYSPSDLACTPEYMMSLKKYKAVLEIDQEKQQVTMQAGLTLTELHTVLDIHGLGFPNLGAVSGISCAGVISTCVHGTGFNYGLLATHVSRLDIMTASGEIITCSRMHNEDIFRSVICGMGSVGVILSITWQCEKTFSLCLNKKSFYLNEMLEDLEAQLVSCDHFKFFWYPHTDKVVAEYASRTTRGHTPPQNSWFRDMLIGFYLLEFLYWLSIFIPALVPLISKLYYMIATSGSKERIDRSYKIMNFNCLFKQYVTEWCIPRNKVADVLRTLRDWTEKSGYKVHFPVEVRFVKADDFYLSPCYKTDSCFINIICYRPYNQFVAHDAYWRFYENLMDSVGGKPHWAKAHNLCAADMEKKYPMFNKYREVCQRLDPQGILRNSNVDCTIFGKT